MTRSIPVALLLLVSAPVLVQSQSLDFSSVLSADKPDAERYLANFIDPFMKGLGHGVNNGWYSTARPHAVAGFHLSFTASAVFVPDQDLLFDVAGFSSLVPANDNDLPTIFGPHADNRLSYTNTLPVTYTDPATGVAVTIPATIGGEFDAVDGLDLENEIGAALVPVPMAQFGVGLLYGTDVKIRWVPAVQTDDFDFSLLGIGLRHDLQRWLPTDLRLPFDTSVMAAWTNLSARGDLSRASGGLGGTDQIARYDISSSTYQLLVSRDVSILTAYCGIGYDTVDASLVMTGEYIIEGVTSVNGLSVPARGVLHDPVDLSFTDAGPRSTLGLRVKLLTMMAHVDYTMQNYNALTIGLGVSFR